MTNTQDKIQEVLQARERILNDFAISKATVDPVIGNYDADSNITSSGSTNRLISDNYKLVQAPELKNSNGSLDPLGIRAKIQADNYAMGLTDAPNLDPETAVYLANNPEVFKQYNTSMNNSIKEAVANKTYIPTDTNKKDVYGRNLTSMQNNTSAMDQGEFLVKTGNASGVSFTGIPFSALNLEKDTYTNEEVNRRAKADLIDSAQSSLLNIGGNLGSLAGKTLAGYGRVDNEDILQTTNDNVFRAQVDEPLIDMTSIIDTGRKALNDKLIEFGDKLNRQGTAIAKHSDQLTGAWNTSSEMIGGVWDEVKEGNLGKAIDKVTVQGLADTITRSLPDMVLSGVSLPLSISTNVNRVLDDYYETNKTDEISGPRLTGVILAGTAISLLDRLGFETILGKSSLSQGIKENVSAVINTLGSNLPKGIINDAINRTVSYAGRVGLTGVVEAGTEVAQESSQIAAVELGYDPNKDIFREENIDRLGEAAVGGFLGGTSMKAVTESGTDLVDLSKNKTQDLLQQRVNTLKAKEEIQAKNQEFTKPYTDKFQSIKDTGDTDLVTSINELIYLGQDLEVEGNTKLQKEVETYKNSLIEKLTTQVADEKSFKFGSSEEALVALDNIYNTASTNQKVTPELETNLNTIAKKYGLENELTKIKDRGQVEEQATISDIGYISYGNQLKKLVTDPDSNNTKINKYVKKLENFLGSQETKFTKIDNILKQAEVQFENTQANTVKFPEYQVRVNPVTGKGKPLEINRQDYENFKQGNLTGYWKILEDTKNNIIGIKNQLNIPGVQESIQEAREDIEVVAPLTSNANINKYRINQQTRFKNNQVNKLIATGSKIGAEYTAVNTDISNTGSYNENDTVAVIFDKPIDNLVYYKKNKSALSRDPEVVTAGNEILKAVKAGATVVTDIKTNRINKKNHKDLISKFLIEAGYRETKVGNGIWKPASKVKEESKTDPSKKENIVDIKVGQDNVPTNGQDIKDMETMLKDLDQEIRTLMTQEIDETNEDSLDEREQELRLLNKDKELITKRINELKGNKPVVSKKESKPKDEAYVKQVQELHSKVQEVKKKLKEIEQENKDTTDLEIEYNKLDNELTSILNGQELDTTNSISEGVEVSVVNKDKNTEPVKYNTSLSNIVKRVNKTLANSLHISAFSESVNKFTDKVVKGLNNILAPVDNTVSKYGNNTVVKEHYNLLDSPARGLIFDKEGIINSNVALSIGASIQDLITNSGSLLKVKTRDEVMRMLDKIYLTTEEYNFFKDKGMFLKVVADDLASNIMKQLGINFNKDIPAELKAKFKADLGNIAINLAQELGYVKVNQISLTTLAKGLSKEAEYGIYNDNSDANNILVSFVTLGSKEVDPELFKTFENELNITSDYNRYPSSKPIKNSKYANEVRNNPYNTMASEVKQALEVQRNTKFVTRNRSIEWLNNNRDLALKLLGYMTTEEIAKLSKLDQETAEAKNESIIRSLDALRDNKLNEMYFDFFYTKNNRYILDSTTINPQTDKQLHRWLVVPEEHISKYSKENQEDKELLAVAIAQAMGMGIDKKQTNQVIEFGSKLLDLTSKEITLLKEGLNKGDLTDFNETTNLHIEIEHLGHFLEAVDVIEQWNDKNTTEIETSISAEFDGLTNGFAIRLMQMPIIKDIYQWLEKVGVFEASINNRTMNNVLGDKSLPFLDSYQTLAYKIVKNTREEILGKLNEKRPSKITGIQVEKVLDALPIKDVNNTITKELRDLFKNPFMVFNYASSIASIKKNMGYVLRDKLINEMVQGKRLELVNALGIKVNDLKNKYPEEIKLKTGLTLDETIRQVIETSYGNQVGDILTDFFAEYLEANDIINNSFRGMFLVFQDAYQKATKDRILTSQEKLDEVIKLIDLLPGIKGVLSKDIREGIAIYETKSVSPTDLKLGKAQTKLKDKEGKVITKAVQGLLKELDMPVNAGAVIPIHSIDGSIMTELLNSMSGVVGIHDAIIPSLRKSTEAIKTYNQKFYELNKQYSILEELVKQMEIANKYANENNIDPVINESNEKARVKLSEVFKQLQKLNQDNNIAREELYNKDLSIGQMVGVDNDSLFITGSNNQINNVDLENQYSLFSKEGDFTYSSANINIEDSTLGDLISNGINTTNVLTYLSKSTESFIADQAKVLLELSELYRGNTIINISSELHPELKDTPATYQPSSDTIFFRSKEDMSKPLVFLHEFTHGLSVQALEFMEFSIENETKENSAKVAIYKSILKDLDIVLKNQDKISENKIYAFTNKAELLAEFMANPLFRARLKQLPNVEGLNFFERLLKAVGSLFGLKRDKLFDLLDRAKDDIFRVNYEVFKSHSEFKDEIDLLLTKPEGYKILDKILKKMREC